MIAENSAVTPLPASASNPNRRHDRVPSHHRSQVPWDSSAQQALRLLTDGPGAPSNCVELIPTGESDAGMMADDVSGRGIAVPVSVFPEDDPSLNSDTGTTDTTDTGNA